MTYESVLIPTLSTYLLLSKHDKENLLMLCVPNVIFTLSPSYFIPHTFLNKQSIFIVEHCC